MQSSRRGRTLIEADRHSLEFTSGQLIIAVCGLLLLWLAGFLMGVVAGRFEFGSKVAELTERSGSVVPVAERDRKPAEPTTKAVKAPNARREAKPAPARDKQVSAPVPQPPAAPAAAVQEPKKQTTSAAKFISDRPSPAATETSPAVVTPAAAEVPETKQAPAKPEPAPAPVPATPVASTTETPALSPLPVSDIPADSNPAPASEGGAKKGKFTIQLISYRASNKKLAENYVQQLKKDGMDVELLMSKDKKFYQVIYGSYPDRPTAERARTDLLQKKADLSQCRVRER